MTSTLPINAESPGVIKVVRCPKVVRPTESWPPSSFGKPGIFGVNKWGSECHFERDGRHFVQVVAAKGSGWRPGRGIPEQLEGHVIEYEGQFTANKRCALYVMAEPFQEGYYADDADGEED